MMRQMRENTKWIMLVTVLAFAALMVFEWGMDMSGQSGAIAAGGELGRVNGEVITYEQYIATYRNLYQQQQSASDGPISRTMNRQIEDAAWDQLVTQTLLQQELRRRNLRVTDDEIRQAALYAPPPDLQSAPEFQTDGQFDPSKYQQFLAQPGLPEEFLQQLEAYYRDIIPRSKLYFQNTAGMYVSDAQLWRMWRDANETATVRYIAFTPEALVPDAEVSITDQAIRQYYNANRDNFIRPAQAGVRYVVLSRSPMAADTATARQLAAEYRLAAAGGEDFMAVGRRAAGDRPLDRFHGELFQVSRGQTAPELENAVFNTAPGQVAEPVLTQAGFHVIRVEDRQGDLAEVRQILVRIALSDEAEDRLLDRADSLDRAASNANLQQAAATMGLEVRTADISPAVPVLPGVGSIDEDLDWVFSDGEVGETSPVMETEQAYYVLELVSRRDEGALTLQEATPTIRAILVREAKAGRARQMLADAERRVRAGEPLEQVATAYGTAVSDAGPFTRGEFVPGLGRLNAAVGAAFGLRAGETSPLIEAEQQLFLIRSVARQEASRTGWQAQIEEQRQRTIQAISDTRWNQFMVALKEDANIVDNRRELLGRTAAATGR
ncbi:peptidylprolyl isomerase [soil metagenome]